MSQYLLQIVIPLLIWTAFVAIHEGGHVLTAHLCGARYAVCQIGLLQINAGGFRHWRITPFNPLGGYVQIEQTVTALSRSGTILFAMGGIITNAVTGISLIGVYGLLLPFRPDDTRPGGAPDLNWIVGIGLASLVAGLTNFIPMRVKMGGRLFYSDGWHLINILRRRLEQ